MTTREVQELIARLCRRSSVNTLHRERAIVTVAELEPALQEYFQTLQIFLGELETPSIIPRMRLTLEEYRRCRMLNPGGWEVWKIPVGLVKHLDVVSMSDNQYDMFFRINPGEVSLFANGEQLDLTEGKGYWMQNEPTELQRKERT